VLKRLKLRVGVWGLRKRLNSTRRTTRERQRSWKSNTHNGSTARLIEVKGIAGDEGVVGLTPNGKAHGRGPSRLYWLYVVTCCKRPERPTLMRIGDPAQLEWDEIRKIDHYALRVATLAASITDA
jgi:Domain of unknown function (DUF3883)